MNHSSPVPRTAAVLLASALAITIPGIAEARIDRDGPVASPIGGSTLAIDTDISTLITAPAVVANGTRFSVTLIVSNVGHTIARDIRCGVTTPRADIGVTASPGIRSRVADGEVGTGDTRTIQLPALSAGQSKSVRLSTDAPPSIGARTVTISARCAPSRLDDHPSNNTSRVIVTLK